MPNQSIGKKLLKLKVINEANEIPSLKTLMIREYILLMGLVVVLPIPFSSTAQGWHDSAAKTYVIEI